MERKQQAQVTSDQLARGLSLSQNSYGLQIIFANRIRSNGGQILSRRETLYVKISLQPTVWPYSLVAV